MVFLHLFDSSETAPGRAARFFRRQSRGDGIALGQLQVGEDFVLQLPIQTPFPKQRQQSTRRAPKPHEDASRNAGHQRGVLSQFGTYTRSCFDPAVVSE